MGNVSNSENCHCCLRTVPVVYADESYNDAVYIWNTANERYNAGEITEEERHQLRVQALEQLGQGLHALQDMEGHSDYGVEDTTNSIKVPHHTEGYDDWKDFDNPRFDIGKNNKGQWVKEDSGKNFGSRRYQVTKRRSKEYLSNFFKAVGE